MAHLWLETGAAWGVMPLSVDRIYCLSGPEPRALANSERADAQPVTLCRSAAEWLLLVRPDNRATVNGSPVDLGIRVLADRDEIVVYGDRSGTLCHCFLSGERLASPQPFPDADGLGRCPRCKQPIENGQAAVQCPGCGVWHHQDERLPCWTYHDTCSLCEQPTALDTGYRWTPEEL